MEYLLDFDDFKLNESQLRNVAFSLATFLGLGISKLDAQQIIKNKPAMNIIDTCNKYNIQIKKTGVQNKQVLVNMLGNNLLEPKKFVIDFIKFLPDRTIVISPEFIEGLNLNLNPETKEVGVNYKINF